MCNAFSCLITINNKVYWRAGVDSHTTLQETFVKEDPQLKDDKEPPKNTFARVEITPKNKDYLKPDKWALSIDESVTPDWLKDEHEDICWKAFEKWKKQVYSGINLKECIKPIHPFKIKPPKKIEVKHLKILLHWASVRDSVRDSVRASVGDSVRASVRASVGDSVWDSVWASVRASVGDSVWDSVGDSVRASVWGSVWGSVGDSVGGSVWAYTGSQFPKIKKWKYVNFKHKGYPFKDAVKLWKMGLVASFDGTKWRLHGGPKAKVLWEGTVEDMKEQVKSSK